MITLYYEQSNSKILHINIYVGRETRTVGHTFWIIILFFIFLYFTFFWPNSLQFASSLYVTVQLLPKLQNIISIKRNYYINYLP